MEFNRTSLELDDTGRIVGFHGLTLKPARHQLSVRGRTLWAWCAIDALGIMAAFDATGVIRSADPQTEEPIEINFVDGRPSGDDGAVFIADFTGCEVPKTDWCPHVNFFQAESTAREWGRANGVTGQVRSLSEATTPAREDWVHLASAEPFC
jgi:alkylmercury lyase